MRALTLALALAACDPPEPPTARALPSPELSLVQDLSMLARAEPMDEDDAARRAEALRRGEIEPELLVDHLLASELVGTRVAMGVLLGGGLTPKDRAPVPSGHVLSSFEAPGGPIYTLRDRCAPDEAVEVSPWWAPDDTVRVCPDALRADVRGDAEGRTCGASTLSPDQVDLCGCGPRLMYCTRDREHYQEVKDSVQDEVSDTLAWIVNQDIPLDELFMMNETVRDRNAEMIYRRARIAAGEAETLADLEGWTDKPRLAPRPEMTPGQHAGVLTAPAMIYTSDALRGVMRDYYGVLWCSPQASSRVTTAAVLGLDVVDLREGAGWKQLAGMPICTDCHARLDYGMQFFSGYPSSTQGIDFRPWEAATGEGPLYTAGIHDPRGEDDLSPQGFARLALDQPEFAECMARKITDYVFSDSATGEDLDAVLDAFEQTRSFRPTLRVAMLRFAERSLSDAPSAPTVATAVARPTGGAPGPEVALSEPLRAAVDDQCAHCHDGGDAEDLTPETLPRDTAQRMLEQVAWGSMPKTPQGMDEPDRAAFIAEMAALLWPDPAEARVATDFFIGGLRAHPVHDFRPALAAVAARAGTDARPYLRAVENSADRPSQRYSPGFAASTAVVALKQCRKEHDEGPALRACVEKATAPEALVAGGGR